jgi:cytoskeletal protein CcmA (bactofilin family)
MAVSSAPAAPAKPAAPLVRPASLLGADLVFEGSIHGDGSLQIDGAIKGDIHVAQLVVGEQAHVEGTIRCGVVEVRGRVVGNIEAQTVKLHETAFVEGDITHGQLSIDVGAYFQGRCQQFRAAQAPQQAATGTAGPFGQAAAMGAAQGSDGQVVEFDGHRG